MKRSEWYGGGKGELETREKKSSWERKDERWKSGRVEQEGEEEGKRDKESGNQRERGCYAFPQHSLLSREQ